MFCYEFSEISKNIFFTEHLQATASMKQKKNLDGLLTFLIYNAPQSTGTLAILLRVWPF